MKKNLMRFFAVIALLGVWTACEKSSVRCSVISIG
jgi:hypothetical protein